MIEDLPVLPQRKRISSSEIFNGPPVPKIERLRSMSEDDFEVMVLEWAYGYLKDKYKQVRQYGGAGDKGRDVVGIYDDGKTDIFQCKHYDSPIAPSQIYVELAKLCYYTFKKEYEVPFSYYIVAPEGVGSKLEGLIDMPSELKAKLIENWEESGQNKISSLAEIKLDGKFKTYVDNFDFSIVKVKQPLELIDEHSKTVYHPSRFGGGLIKARAFIPTAAITIEDRELQYTTQLLEVYSEKLKYDVKTTSDLNKKSPECYEEFGEHRDSFYSAESLEKFSRDNFPEPDPLPFDELKTEALSLVKTNLSLKSSDTGYVRLQSSILETQRQNFSSNPLKNEITIIDKKGLCHHLANDKKVKWKI
jgi:hypothetical protein